MTNTSSNAAGVLRFNGQTGAFEGVFIPEGSGGGHQLGSMVFGPDGNLLVSSGGLSQVLRFDGKTGEFLGKFADLNFNPFYGASKLFFGPDGNLYASDASIHFPGHTTGDSVRRYNGQTGALIDVFVQPDSGGMRSARGHANLHGGRQRHRFGLATGHHFHPLLRRNRESTLSIPGRTITGSHFSMGLVDEFLETGSDFRRQATAQAFGSRARKVARTSGRLGIAQPRSADDLPRRKPAELPIHGLVGPAPQA